MTIKINATDLGIKKPVEINETFKTMKQTLQVQIQSEKLSEIPDMDDDGESYVAFLQNQLDAQNLIETYVVEILGLTEAQKKKFEELESEKANDLFGQIISGILHLTDVEDVDDETPSNEDNA